MSERDPQTRRILFVVTGRLQGVGFRASARDAARDDERGFAVRR